MPMQILVGRGRSTPAFRNIFTNFGMTKVSRTKKAIPRKTTTIFQEAILTIQWTTASLKLKIKIIFNTRAQSIAIVALFFVPFRNSNININTDVKVKIVIISTRKPINSE